MSTEEAHKAAEQIVRRMIHLGDEAVEPFEVTFATTIIDAAICDASKDLLAACIAVIEATGGSSHWSGWTKRFLVLTENALRKAGIDPATIEAKDTVGPEDEA